MYYLHYTFLLGLLMLFTPENQPPLIPANTVGTTTTTGVGLGRPKKDCDGKGLCVITNDVKGWKIEERKTIATLSFNRASLVSMFIAFADLNENTLEEFFSEEHFIMDESFNTQLRVGEKTYKIHIQRGKYPIRKQGKGLKIDFER